MTTGNDRDHRIARLSATAAARSDAAHARAQRAITKLRNTGQPITFIAVSRTAGVSTSFLYQHSELRAEIVRRRSATDTSTTVTARPSSATVDSLRTKLQSAIARNQELTDEIVALRTENQTLRSRLLQVTRSDR